MTRLPLSLIKGEAAGVREAAQLHKGDRSKSPSPPPPPAAPAAAPPPPRPPPPSHPAGRPRRGGGWGRGVQRGAGGGALGRRWRRGTSRRTWRSGGLQAPAPWPPAAPWPPEIHFPIRVTLSPAAPNIFPSHPIRVTLSESLFPSRRDTARGHLIALAASLTPSRPSGVPAFPSLHYIPYD